MRSGGGRVDEDRGDRLEQLFEEAQALPLVERDAFLERACADDPELRLELRSLLAASAGADDLLEDLGRLVEPETDGPASSLVEGLKGRYEIERRVGAGGMASVYSARDLRHGRRVALKVLKPEVAAAVGAARFLTEIKTTASLHHPNILPLFDSGDVHGNLYYVMPFVEGETLRRRLDRERQLPIDEAVAIAASLAEALDYAHRQGVVHRDIKPANVLLLDRKPVIADFGIALALSGGGSERLTQTGFSLGTPHYMSPEQATGDRAVGPATDIWALGCVLYEMLVGTPPFTGRSAQSVMAGIMTGEVESTTVHRRTIPVEIDAALMKALERVPTDRFASAGEFADVLAGRASIGLPRRSAGRTSASPGRIAVYLAVLGVVASVAWALGGRMQADPTPMRVADVFPPGQELRAPAQLRLSADGSTLAYTGPGEGAGGWRLWIRRWSDLDGNGRPVPGTDNIDHFDLSPAGDELAVVAGGSIQILDLESNLSRTILPARAGCCLTWSDEGDRLYYTDESGGLSRVSVEGGGEEVLTPPGAGLLGYQWPAPVPGTDLVVFEMAELFGRGSLIALLDKTTGRVDTLGPGSHPVPFGDQILFTTEVRSAELWSMDVRGGGRASRAIVTGLGGNLDDGRGAFDASPVGHVAYSRAAPQSGPTRTPVWVERDGTSRPVDPTMTGRFLRVRLSPDGTRLLLWGPAGIHVKDLSDGPLVRLLSLEEPRHRPSWSPDGLEIFYSVIRNGKAEVMRVRADGSLPPRGTGLESPEATMTRDGSRWIFRTPNIPEAPDLMTVSTDLTSEPVPLVATDASESQPALSRDGRWFAFSSDFSGVRQVYVRPFPRADVQIPITLRGGGSPLFSPTRDELFVVDDGWLVAVSYAADPTFRVTGREPLFEVAGYAVEGDPSSSHHYDVSKDGSRFIMLRGVGAGSSMEPSVVLLLNVMATLGFQGSP